MRSLFNLKDKNRHKSNVIYRAKCTCGDTYIGKQKELSNTQGKCHNSEPACHLAKHPTHAYTWDTACTEKKKTFRRKIKYNGGPAYCLLKINTKQTSTFLNQECKFPPCTTDDERTVEIILTFKFLVISSFF